MYIHGWFILCGVAMCRHEPYKQAGWLDRIVHINKANFMHEMQLMAPINIEASIERAPVGYVDSPDWDINSVARLLTLIKASEKARPVRKQLRRMLAPTRRFMSKAKSYQFFPSLPKTHEFDFYYDGDTSDSEEKPITDSEIYQDVVVIRNPVESRLPSARISINLLKNILEARALAARKMPPTTKASPEWTWPSIALSTAKSESTLSSTTEETNANATSSSSTTEETNANATSSSSANEETNANATSSSSMAEETNANATSSSSANEETNANATSSSSMTEETNANATSTDSGGAFIDTSMTTNTYTTFP